MINIANAEHCLSFIHTQLQTSGKPVEFVKKEAPRAVTISRQAGCGALAVAQKLADYLQSRAPEGAAPWTVFDQNLIDKVLEDHNLPARLARLLPENTISRIDDILAELFDVRPSVETIVRQTTETVLRLASLGNVILIGRGSTVTTAKLPHVLHVRLVAPLEKRVEYAHQKYNQFNLTADQARKFCRNEDRGRERYFKKYFNADINDPLLYHLIINTGLVNYGDAAKLIGDAVLNLH
jgi:cytidylate kinase